MINLFPDDKVLDWSKLKQIADDILKVYLKWKISTIYGRNIVRKGEIACNMQFLLFSHVFLSCISLVRPNTALCGNGLKNCLS